MIKVLVVALTSLAFNGVSFAQAKPATPAPPAAPAMEKKTEMKSEKAQATVLTGKVTSVDAKAGKLMVKTKDKEVNLTTDSKSTKAALEKLKVGDMVKVSEGWKDDRPSSVKAEPKTKRHGREERSLLMKSSPGDEALGIALLYYRGDRFFLLRAWR